MTLDLHYGDCLDVMATLQDASVFVITDPPYGKRYARGGNGFGDNAALIAKPDSVKWDATTPDIEYFDAIRRVGRQSIIFGGNYFTDKLPPSNCWLIWDKKGHHQFSNPFADCELIWTSLNKVVKKYTLIQQGFVTEAKELRFHPTQKPVELMRRIIRDFTKEGDTVLDPFMGSGSTGVACQMERRNFIGIEKDAGYFEIAQKRIAEAAHKEPLFAAA